MCTVTFIPSGDNFFFTSNRDERAERAVAGFPELHIINGRHLLFPLDPQGGGSWITVHESGNIAVLLNGANRAHIPKPPYRKSRGMVLLDLISKMDPIDAFKDSDFNRIEPFTIILFEEKKFYSCKWDGIDKNLESLDKHKPQIWSSVTLFDPATILKREEWFSSWVSENDHPSIADIVYFHLNAGDGDPVNDLHMNRGGRLFTNSISSIRLSEKSAAFRYIDLRSGITADSFLPIQKTISIQA